MRSLAAAVLALCALPATAQELLIRNATVHTGSSPATLTNTDVLVSGGVIRQMGAALTAPAGVRVVEANERRLTPGLFGGVTGIGIEEVSGERSTVDSRLGLGAAGMPVRPEFDVTLAYNPDSLLLPVARIEGIGWTLVSAGSDSEGSIIGGQGGVFRLDGSADPIGPKVLYVDIGADAAGLSGHSRAAQWMILDQLVDEVRGRIPGDAKVALLTPAGRKSLATYLDNGGRVLVGVDRAADIRQLLRWSAKNKVKIAILGGAEAWKLARELAAADVAVFVNPLDTLPGGFDQIGATPENAARLAAAGVAVGFSQSGDGSHNARKIRQAAGNAVANGLPWEAGVAGLTSVPAKVFGVADTLGSIAVGKRADLVLWSGDPLEVNAVATQVWFDGKPIQMRSRQTDLRDRYLQPHVPAERGGLPPAYPAAVR
ncbi:amidohydrolase family protein [Novilysobacter antarcticus]|uniref:amidohydrolase family protein n=1 Tax=Novilysobacter antarcticus TaxID=2862543 RepID=UPI001C99C3B0|nr:amidohydrolase family protein [Lysobacter antarcticus]